MTPSPALEPEVPRWPEDPPGEDEDPGGSPWDCPGFLDLPLAEQARRLGCSEEDLGGIPVPESIAAGFTHGQGGGGAGFGSGGELDVMLPGARLGAYIGRVAADLAVLSDDALAGVQVASRRQQSLYASVEFRAVAELDRRRRRADGSPGAFVDAELGSALTLTPRAAQSLLGYARELTRLAPTMALLAAGVLDPRRAELIARHLEMLPDEHAAAVQDLVLPRAGQMTTGRLGDALKAAVTRVDPAAARRRREKAQRDARVECWAEESGTAALCGRDLPPAEVLAADKRIDAAARWLQEHGAEGTLDQLRAKAYLALLNGQPLESLLPATPATPGTAGQPAPASAGASAPASAGTSAGTGAGTSAPAGVPGSGGAGSAAPGGWPAGLTGTVHLTMPASAWAGQDDHPGEISGYGTADAGTCRDLAARLAAHGTARWCITLTDHQGRPVGHGCARAGPGPPGNARDPGSWLATVTITPIESGTCQHRREAPGYRIPDSLRHVIKVRSRRCGFPGCRRPAARCDDDHTVPYHLGGKSCECNLYPLCRRHHRCKQDEGWHLRQPEPGRLIWTTPSGRTYATTTEPYPI